MVKTRVGRVCLAVLVASSMILGPAVTWRGAMPSLDPAHVEAADITYIYDALGRLVGVVDPAGDTGIYHYDVVGNLLAISRQSSALVSIIDFTPGSGPIGSTVTISGTGFSATPSQNTVTFNGTAATVTTSAATQIVTTVPAAATTGPIAVAAPAGSATSSGSFLVTAPMAPSITSFTPTIGIPGTAVTVTGTNFESVTTSNRLNFNLARGAVGSANTTTLGATVPGGATSGHVTVATPAGATQSSADFFVPPPGFATADAVFTGRVVINGGTLTATVTPANKIGLVVFDGTAGQVVSLGMTAVTISATDVTIFRPDGATLLWQYAGRYDMHPGGLPVTGTYTILLDPRSTWTGTITLTLSQDLPPVPITIGGASIVLSVTRPAQRTPLTFSGTTGQRLSLGATAASFSSTVTVLKPDGATLVASAGLGDALDLPVLPATGTYTIFVDPNNAATGSLTVTLSEEISGPITIGGAAVPLSITRPGQRARLTFQGTAGQRLDLGLTGATIPSETASILNPDGSTLASLGFGAYAAAVDTPPLPVTGTYAIVIDPASTYTGNVTLTLSEELAGPISPGGAAVPLSISRAGQRARLSFTGTTGQRVSVGLTGVTITQSTVSIIKPDGSTLGATTSAFLEPQTLPTTGSYAVLVDPSAAYTGTATVTLYDVPADVTGSVTINGAALHVTLTAPGQQGFVTFPGTTGQAVSVRGATSTVGCMNVFLMNPTGGGYAVISPCTASFTLGSTLTQTGTYTIRVDPSAATIGSVDMSVTSP
jgi:YD repeat-containing protein